MGRSGGQLDRPTGLPARSGSHAPARRQRPASKVPEQLAEAVKRYLVVQHEIPVYRMHAVALGNAPIARRNRRYQSDARQDQLRGIAVDGKQFGGPGWVYPPVKPIPDRCGAAVTSCCHAPEAIINPRLTAPRPFGRQPSSRNTREPRQLGPRMLGGRFFCLSRQHSPRPTNTSSASSTSPPTKSSAR
jgi:hypothetical protein